MSEHMARFGVDEKAFITIADSALVSPGNMEQLSGAQRFITRLPATYADCGRVISQTVAAEGAQKLPFSSPPGCGMCDSGMGGPSTPLIRVHSSPGKPADAFVAVPYHSYWIWIDDRDLPSKRTFSFLMVLFTLVEKTDGKEGAPIVTIPAG